MILDKIKKPNDIHKIPLAQFPQLADEIRSFLIESVSKTGGHLASNLGVVELTLALHNVLDFPSDKLIWDVGHQAYTHKILTGRKDEFAVLRKERGLSGFPKRNESSCDSFDAGHSSNSISAGLGYVRARDLLGEKYHVVSVIGDGALTGGMAYEALNNAAELDTNFIIVLNDNNMSISKNVGGMSNYLSALRTAEAYTGMKISVNKAVKKIPHVGTAMVDAMRRTKSSIKQLFIPGMLFENMGLTYLGPVDGPVFYTHLDVYKRQSLPLSTKWTVMPTTPLIFWMRLKKSWESPHVPLTGQSVLVRNFVVSMTAIPIRSLPSQILRRVPRREALRKFPWMILMYWM